jgi:hypothetical protein
MANLGIDELDHLSRWSDHLGALAVALRDLGGPTTLLHELVQNADDSKTATVARFEISAKCLTVWNDGEFTSCGNQELRLCPWASEQGRGCDLHSFRSFAGRHKAHDAATTGAFGVGFTAVYQVTDYPELITGGGHLILNELAEEKDRITICKENCDRDHEMSGTTFVLPWARENTEMRDALQVQPVSDENINLLQDALMRHASDALLFLERVHTIEIITPTTNRTVVRSSDANRIHLSDGAGTEDWLILRGDFDTEARALRAESSGLIEEDRSSRVKVALCMGEQVKGRLYAGLPTQTQSEWGGHIEATFYPRTDRTGVLFDEDYKSKWNRAALKGAASAVAHRLEEICEALGVEQTWQILVDVEKAAGRAGNGTTDRSFASFWSEMRPVVADSKVMLTTDGSLATPRGSLLPRDTTEYAAAAELAMLDLRVVDESLHSLVHQTTLSAYGLELLTAQHVVNALLDAGLNASWRDGEGVFTRDQVGSTLVILEQLLSRRTSVSRFEGITEVAVVPCTGGMFAPAAAVVSTLDEDETSLFQLVLPTLLVVDRVWLTDTSPLILGICPRLSAELSLDLLSAADTADMQVVAEELLGWFDDHRAELTSADTRNRLANLPLFPSATGLKPLTVLSLPGGFDDPIGIASLVDTAKAQGHIDLLRLLGAQELTVSDYLSRHVAPLVEAKQLTNDQLAGVLRVISNARAEIAEDPALRQNLAALPLVVCTNGTASAPQGVHFDSSEMRTISPDSAVVDGTALPEHIRDTLDWLGVARSPRWAALGDAAVRLAHGPKDPDRGVVEAILDVLKRRADLDSKVPTPLQGLVEEAWLPIEGGGRSRPADTFPTYSRHLFESQGPKLGLELRVQQAHASTLRWLGMPSEPTTEMVVAHLLHCASHGTEVSSDIYRFLGETDDETAVRELRDRACIQVSPGEYVAPHVVFWTQTSLGRWARQLDPERRRHFPFFDRVGVKEEPGAVEIESILLEIRREMGNDLLDENTDSVVNACWSLLSKMLLEDQGSTVEVLTRLTNLHCAVDSRLMLAQPNQLYFRDGRGLSDRIHFLAHNVIRRERSTWRALSAAGVRAVGEIIEIIPFELEAQPETELKLMIEERWEAIDRVFEGWTDDADHQIDTGLLHSLKILRAPALMVTYRAESWGLVEQSEPEPVHAVYLEDEHTLIYSEGAPRRAIARELAHAVAPEGDPSRVAPLLAVVLSAPTWEDANRELDEYGVADLVHVERVAVNSDLVTEGDMGQDIVTHDRSVETERDSSDDTSTSDDSPLNYEGRVNSGLGEGRADHGSTNGGTPRRKQTSQSRLLSYVVTGGADEEEIVGDEAPSQSPVDSAGIKRVLAFEASCGRDPHEQDHANPGFDVLSYKNEEIARRIEVKSTGGAWTVRGVLMSSRQYEEAVKYPDEFWLYVVEFAEDDDRWRIHRISNPATRIRYYGFDGHWRVVAEADVDRDSSGVPTAKSTRSLLAWGKESPGGKD